VVASETIKHLSVNAEINYVRNPQREVLTFVTEAEERSTMQVLPGRAVRISNARSLESDLDREGFALVPHTSSIVDFDLIQDDAEIDQRYMDEMADLLGQVTGATLTFMLGRGKRRYGEGAKDKLAPLSNAKPARYPHADNTDASATGLVEMVGAFVDGIDLTAYSRYALYNMWRAFSEPPLDFPLAVCDARTVTPHDEVTVTAITVEKDTGEITHDTTGYLYNPAHRWYYYRDMTPEEVLVFKAHDTDRRRSIRVPHSAFTDPTCPAGVPTRASVEIRGLALFI
jgi:hypothetical protein